MTGFDVSAPAGSESPSSAELLDYATGQMHPLHRVVLAVHLAANERSAQQVVELAAPGGHWLGGLPSPLPRPEIWEQIERRLDDDPRRAVDALDLPLPPNARGELATSGFFVTDQPWIDLPAGSSRAIRVGSDPAQDLELFVVATPGGERFPRHRHSGAEVVAVLVGAYVENDIGRTAAGDYRRYAPGSIHSPTIVGTDVCMALTLNQGGVEFLAA